MLQDPSYEETDAPESFQEKRSLKYYGLKILAAIKWIVISFLGVTLFLEVLFIFINPPMTTLMIKRVFEQLFDGRKITLEKRWAPIENISRHMIHAVVASEDNRFLNHWGVDLDAIDRALEYNKRHNRKHGASTITMQVAKNLFLWPGRTWIRKGLELYFTVTIELLWSKKRIMEIYLNVIETGDGIYGIEAAANRYFHKPAKSLTRKEAALIAASLPNPRKRNPSAPSSFLLKHQARILNVMKKMSADMFTVTPYMGEPKSSRPQTRALGKQKK